MAGLAPTGIVVRMEDAERLFEEATRGDRSALESMLQVYLPQLHAFVQARLGPSLQPRESSVDVVQSVCRQLLESHATFEFRGEERFRAWLFTAALNKVREKHRRHRGAKRDPAREVKALDHEPVSAAAFLLTPSQAAIGKETATAVAAALASLSEDHREVVTLARLVRLPHAVIAEVMDRSEDAVRKLLARAMLVFAAELEQRGVDVGNWAMP